MLPRKIFDKIGAIWCILGVPKLVYQPKNQHFWIINQQPKFCAKFFSKINPDTHFGTKINTFTFYKGDLGRGAIAPGCQRNAKKWRLKVFHTRREDPVCCKYPVMISIQIHARGFRGFFLKWCNTAHS